MTTVADELREELLRSRAFLSWRKKKPFQYIGQNDTNSTAEEKHFSAVEVGKQWGVPSDLIRSLFRDEPGVLKIDRPGTRAKRSYSTLRRPESVLVRVHTRLTSRPSVLR
jgi:hypothetical protein